MADTTNFHQREELRTRTALPRAMPTAADCTHRTTLATGQMDLKTRCSQTDTCNSQGMFTRCRVRSRSTLRSRLCSRLRVMHQVEKQSLHFIKWHEGGACVYIASLPINANTEPHNLRVNCIQLRVGPDMFGQANKVNRQTGSTSCAVPYRLVSCMAQTRMSSASCMSYQY